MLNGEFGITALRQGYRQAVDLDRAGVCQADNPRFNRSRFFDACGAATARSATGRKVA